VKEPEKKKENQEYPRTAAAKMVTGTSYMRVQKYCLTGKTERGKKIVLSDGDMRRHTGEKFSG